jgi:prophage regulatory protein
MKDQRILRKAAVAERLDVSIGTVDNIRKRDASFPKPVKLGSRSIGWRSNDLDGWIAAREAQQ